MLNVGSDKWQTCRLGNVLQLRRERARGSEELLSVTRDRGVVRQAEAGRRDISSDDKSSYWRVHPGDIVYNTMRMWQGVVGRSEFEGIVSPAYTVCQVAPIADSRFLAYKLKHSEMISSFYRLSQGLVSDTWNLKYPSFASIATSLPGLHEQERIADVLDVADKRIDTSISSIVKLRLRHAGMVRSLLAQSNVPACPLSDFLSGRPRNGFSPSEVESWSGAVVLGLGCLTVDGFAPRQIKNVPVRNPRYVGSWLTDGDLLMSRSNTLELVGLVGRYRDIGTPCLYPDLMMKLTPKVTVLPEFLEVVLRDPLMRSEIQGLAQGTSGTMVKITGSAVMNLRVRIPELAVQDRILRVIRAGVAEIECREKEVAELRLLKQGLMDDLLSGRVRVTSVN
jgi:type I restriction enzyme, S subunit